MKRPRPGLDWLDQRRLEDGDQDYVEAYPRLAGSEARNAHLRGLNMCVWRTQNGIPAFAADVKWESHDRAEVILASLEERPAQFEGRFEFSVIYVGSRDDNKRPLLVCPRCRYPRSYLVFRSKCWHCRRCHGLHYRSTRIGSAVQRAEKYARLNAELGEMIDAGRRRDVIRRLQAKVDEALKLAGPLPHRSASSKYSKQLTTRWQRAEFVQIGGGD